MLDTMKRKPDWRIKALASCASKDQTRYRLTGIAYDRGHWFAIDGHRMMVCETLSVFGEAKPGTTYDKDILLKAQLVPLDVYGEKPVNFKQLIPDLGKAKEFKVTIPQWMVAVKPEYRCIGRSKAEDEYMKTPRISFDGEHWTTKSQGALFTVNMGYLAVLAGLDCLMYVTDVNSPVVFKCSYEHWTYVLMPVRAAVKP